MKPIRIQRKRAKGWKMPENTVGVTRPGEFGNPFKVGGYYKIGAGRDKGGLVWVRALEAKYADSSYTLIETTEQAIEMYREFLKRYPLRETEIEKLRGKNLACFCPPDKPCHADVLLEIANS